MKISPCVKNGQPAWRLEYRVNGKRRRRFFDSQAEAKAAKAETSKQQADFGGAFDALPARRKADIIRLLADMDEAGWTLERVWEVARSQKPAAAPVKATELGATYERFMLAKGRERLAKKTMTAFKSNVGRFVKGREPHPWR